MSFSLFKTPHHGTLTLLLCAALIEMTGYFMLSPLLVLSLNAQGVSHSVIGLFSAMSWLALLISAPYAANCVNRLGNQNTLRLCAVIPLASGALYGVSSALAVWFLIAFFGSLASSLRWICSEATVAALASDDTRARWVSAYSTVIGLTFTLGPAGLSFLMHHQAQPLNQGLIGMAWWVAMGLISIGAALTFAIRLPNSLQARASTSGTPIADLIRVSKTVPLLIVAGFTGGFFEVGLNGVLPLYGLSFGWTAAQSTVLVSISAVGGILGVLVTGWLSNQGNRLNMMTLFAACLVLACTAQWLVPYYPNVSWAVVTVWGFAGAALYILIMVDIGAQHSGAALVQRTALLVMAYTIGGLLAPALGGVGLEFKRAYAWPVFEGLTSVVAMAGFFTIVYLSRLNKVQP